MLSNISVSKLNAIALIFIQVHLGNTVCSVPDTIIKQTSQQSESHEFFGFPVHIKVMFTLYCSLFSVQ